MGRAAAWARPRCRLADGTRIAWRDGRWSAPSRSGDRVRAARLTCRWAQDRWDCPGHVESTGATRMPARGRYADATGSTGRGLTRNRVPANRARCRIDRSRQSHGAATCADPAPGEARCMPLVRVDAVRARSGSARVVIETATVARGHRRRRPSGHVGAVRPEHRWRVGASPRRSTPGASLASAKGRRARRCGPLRCRGPTDHGGHARALSSRTVERCSGQRCRHGVARAEAVARCRCRPNAEHRCRCRAAGRCRHPPAACRPCRSRAATITRSTVRQWRRSLDWLMTEQSHPDRGTAAAAAQHAERVLATADAPQRRVQRRRDLVGIGGGGEADRAAGVGDAHPGVEQLRAQRRVGGELQARPPRTRSNRDRTRRSSSQRAGRPDSTSAADGAAAPAAPRAT